MMVLLSKKEYDDLANRGTAEQERQQTIINKLCMMVANHMPVNWKWNKQGPIKPWTCRHKTIYEDEEYEDDIEEEEWYCGRCPVQDYCTMEKAYAQ